jgi:transcriptional regulator with XRE-family HTH domain
MDIMDTARLNIKKHREIKGLRQQDVADKLCMSLRSYQSLESGETKLDLERLELLAKTLETSIEELLKSDGMYVHQEVKDGGSGTGCGINTTGNIYNYNAEKEIIDKLIAAKDDEIQLLKDENKFLREEIEQLVKNKS